MYRDKPRGLHVCNCFRCFFKQSHAPCKTRTYSEHKI
uniref:Uncharacterized protein n=1 Tax=Anguilla anguilla TaxID=7936 RepID=A0A0E9PLJ8_ANGAN